MEIENICYGCMSEKPEGISKCNICGYDLEEEEGSFAALPPGTELDNRYLIGRVLGDSGGFGITYLAYDKNLYKKVAIKEYFPSGIVSRDIVQRTIMPNHSGESERFDNGMEDFMDEARILAKFNNPNIVKIHNFFYENETVYMVMEYYDGYDLKHYLEKMGRPLTENEALDIIVPIMEGLKEVHEKNFMHRDIKPSNIYITGEGKPVLLDFGSARIAQMEKSKSILLTPGFAPIEQYSRNSRQGPWTDVYGVAATLYNLVTGEEPPEASDRIIEDKIEYVGNINRELTKNFSNAVMKGLSVKFSNRYQKIEDFQKAVCEGNKNRKTKERKKDKKKQVIKKAAAVFVIIAAAAVFAKILSYGGVEIKTITSGVIYIDNKKIKEIEAGKSEKINWLKYGSHKIEVRYGTKNDIKEIKSGWGNMAKLKYTWEPQTDNMSFIKGGDFPGGIKLSDFYILNNKVTVDEYGKFIKEMRYKTTAERENYSNKYEGGQWKEIKGLNWKSNIKSGDAPVGCVSYIDTVRYCNWKSEKNGLPPAYDAESGILIDEKNMPTTDLTLVKGYRLPTESEWEYIATEKGKIDFAEIKTHEFSGEIKDLLRGGEWTGETYVEIPERNKMKNPYYYVENSFIAVRGAWIDTEETRLPNSSGYNDFTLGFRLVLMK